MMNSILRKDGKKLISFIKGTAADMTENSLIVEAAQIGFEILMTGTDLSRITIGEEVKLYTYFQVREDAMVLFGFLSKDDLAMFKLLLGVNGIGPKAALGILSGITADELRFALLSDDVKTLSKAPGVGKKTAQKLILELKDKLSLEDTFEQKLANTRAQAAAVTPSGMSDARKEAVEALTALGYSGTEALRAVRAVPEEIAGVENILKDALKHL